MDLEWRSGAVADYAAEIVVQFTSGSGTRLLWVLRDDPAGVLFVHIDAQNFVALNSCDHGGNCAELGRKSLSTSGSRKVAAWLFKGDVQVYFGDELLFEAKEARVTSARTPPRLNFGRKGSGALTLTTAVMYRLTPATAHLVTAPSTSSRTAVPASPASTLAARPETPPPPTARPSVAHASPAVQPSPLPMDGYAISGLVRRAADLRPVAGSVVSLIGMNASQRWETMTDAAGAYRVVLPKDAVARSKWFHIYVQSSDPRLVGAYWTSPSSNSDCYTTSRICLPSIKTDLTGMDVVLAEGFVMTGRVTSRTTGSPIANVLVRLHPPVASETESFPSAAGASSVAAAVGPSRTTDANGYFEFTQLPRGVRYVVQFDTTRVPAYAGEWWRGASTQQAATVISMTADVPGVDAQLGPAR